MLTVVKKTNTDHVTPDTAYRPNIQTVGFMRGHARIGLTHESNCDFSMSLSLCGPTTLLCL
jgi:hypothetical protein